MLKGFWKVCRAPRSFATSKTFFSPPTPEIAITLAWMNSRVSSRSMSSPFSSGMTMSVMTKSVGLFTTGGIRLGLDQQSAAFGEGTFCCFGEMLEITPAGRPRRHRAKGTTIRRAKQHQPGPHTADHPAWERQPAGAKRVDGRRFGKRRPESMLLFLLD